jgi:hypothetical protein
MKRLILILAILIFAAPAMAQTWHPANQVTLMWDAVPMPLCSSGAGIVPNPPICPTPGAPAIGEIKYQVYTRSDLVSLGTKVGSEITANQLLISLSAWGSYYFGVESIAYFAGQTIGMKSQTKAWSNIAEDCGPDGPFGVIYLPLPAKPGGIRIGQ